MRKLAALLVFVLLVLAPYSTSLMAAAPAKPPTTTPPALNGTYAVQWTLTDVNGYPRLFQGTLKFDDTGLVLGSDNLFTLEPDGTFASCSNSAMPYSPTGPGTLAGYAANFVVVPDIACGARTYRACLIITLADGGRQFWLTGVRASYSETAYTLSGRGILQ